MKTLNLKYFGVRILIFRGHVPCDVIGTWPSDSVRALSYWWSMMTMRLSCTDTEIRASKILGSRVWPFGVTWRHRWRDHWTRRRHFPIGGQWWPCVYLAPLWRYEASKLRSSHVKGQMFTAHARCHVTSWPVGGGGQKWLHIWSSRCHIAYSLYKFYGAIRWRLKAVCRCNFYTGAFFEG